MFEITLVQEHREHFSEEWYEIFGSSKLHQELGFEGFCLFSGAAYV